MIWRTSSPGRVRSVSVWAGASEEAAAVDIVYPCRTGGAEGPPVWVWRRNWTAKASRAAQPGVPDLFLLPTGAYRVFNAWTRRVEPGPCGDEGAQARRPA